MSQVADIHTLSVQLPSTLPASGTIPILYVPSFGGGITLLNAYLTANGAASTACHAKLITLANLSTTLAGTETAKGTIATATTDGHIVFKAASAAPFTISDVYVGPGTWVAYQGTATDGGTAAFTVYLAYVMGR